MRAVITGASRGIGEAIREALIADCWTTVDVSRTGGQDVVGLDFDQVMADADPSLLVYCAGHVDVMRLVEFTEDEWRYHLEVNLTAAWRALCAFWEQRAGRPGTVVFVASTAALRPCPQWGPYAASKAALVNMALTAAIELAPEQIRVYCVAPGRCATHLRARLAPDEDPESIMQPDEVARAVMRLVDDHDGVLAGQVVEVARR